MGNFGQLQASVENDWIGVFFVASFQSKVESVYLNKDIFGFTGIYCKISRGAVLISASLMCVGICFSPIWRMFDDLVDV